LKSRIQSKLQSLIEKDPEICVNKKKKHIEEKTRGVSHCGIAIYIKKNLKAKEEL